VSSAKDLGSFEELEARYSCVFPPGDEPDPSVVRAIRTVCPNYAPMWVARALRTPTDGLHVVKYHVIGTWQAYPTDGYVIPIVAPRPYGFKFHGGVLYAQRTWSLPWPKDSWQKDVNFPEQGLPYDYELFWYVRQVYGEHGIPFGTWAQGDMRHAGREQVRNVWKRRADEKAQLKKVQENARLELRSRVANSPTAMRSFDEWKDAMVNDKAHTLYKEYEPKGFRDQVEKPAPPATV